jgi:hypothetical protein
MDFKQAVSLKLSARHPAEPRQTDADRGARQCEKRAARRRDFFMELPLQILVRIPGLNLATGRMLMIVQKWQG